MSGEINVISRTQIIYVDPTSGSVSVINAGPQGPAGQTGGATGPGSTPTGMITMFGGAASPAGWLICDGAEVGRIQYATLFSIIGTLYGIGDGATTFKLPDLRAKLPMGFKTGDAEFSPIGHGGGGKNHRHPLGGAGNGFARISVASVVPQSETWREEHITTPQWTGQLTNITPLGFVNDPVVVTRGVRLGGYTDDGGIYPPYTAVNYIIKT